MQQTLDGSGSELADALKYVDEQMLTGMTDAQKAAIRPLLVRPLMQSVRRDRAADRGGDQQGVGGAGAATVPPDAGDEIPVRHRIARRKPAMPKSAWCLVRTAPSPNSSTPRLARWWCAVATRSARAPGPTWASIWRRLWSPASRLGGAAGGQRRRQCGGVQRRRGQTSFDLQALGAVSATEFTIEIDGQALRWRGQPQPWVHMAWPNPAGVPGAKITAITPEGRSVVVFNEPGHFGLKKMIDAAKRKRKDNGAFELTWDNAGVSVTANLKIVGTTPPPCRRKRSATAGFKRLRLPDVVTASSACGIDTAPATATPAVSPAGTPPRASSAAAVHANANAGHHASGAAR
jgi:type VI secretion system protein ImpL